MKTLTKETLNEKNLIACGGNKWEKESIKRIYLDSEAIEKAFGLKINTKKIKVFFDCVTCEMFANKGSARVAFNEWTYETGIKCGNPFK